MKLSELITMLTELQRNMGGDPEVCIAFSSPFSTAMVPTYDDIESVKVDYEVDTHKNIILLRNFP